MSEEEALQEKNKGNEAFGRKDWDEAIKHYTRAIELDDTKPVYYSNRAQVGYCSLYNSLGPNVLIGDN